MRNGSYVGSGEMAAKTIEGKDTAIPYDTFRSAVDAGGDRYVVEFTVTESPSGGKSVRSVEITKTPEIAGGETGSNFPESTSPNSYDNEIVDDWYKSEPTKETTGWPESEEEIPELNGDPHPGIATDIIEGYTEGAEKNLKSPNAFSQLNTYGDALRENLGPAYQSHKAEYDDILNQAKEHGVEVTYRKGTLAYEPSLMAGKPGRLILDPEASIGALRHEFKHLLDDAVMGYPGFRIMADRDAYWELERRGYMEELNLARQIKDTKAEKLILQEMHERMNEIYGGE